jgi:hypothetical protein
MLMSVPNLRGPEEERLQLQKPELAVEPLPQAKYLSAVVMMLPL